MSEVIDVDALIAEDVAEAPVTVIRLQGREWSFRSLADIPARLYTVEARDSAAELATVAMLLTDAVADEQREEFVGINLTVRQAWATFHALIDNQQGVSPGE